MPAEAKKQTPEGAAAFAEYYFDLINFTYWTNDTGPIRSVTKTSCELCGELIDTTDQNSKNGAWTAGGEINAKITLADLYETGADASVAFALDQSKMMFYNSDGSIYGHLPATDKPTIGALGMTFDRKWVVTQLSYAE